MGEFAFSLVWKNRLKKKKAIPHPPEPGNKVTHSCSKDCTGAHGFQAGMRGPLGLRYLGEGPLLPPSRQHLSSEMLGRSASGEMSVG